MELKLRTPRGEEMPEGEIVIESAELVSDPTTVKGVTIEITLRDARFRKYRFTVAEFAHRFKIDDDFDIGDTKFSDPPGFWS